jgi:hypothetical protein
MPKILSQDEINFLLGDGEEEGKLPIRYTEGTKIDNDEAIRLVEEYFSSITRVEVITTKGREYVKRCDSKAHFKLSLQDDGRTLKLFEELAVPTENKGTQNELPRI